MEKKKMVLLHYFEAETFMALIFSRLRQHLRLMN